MDIRPFLDLSNEAYIAINDLGQILYTNQSFRTITGYSEKDLETLHFMEIFSREDRPYIRAGVQAFDTESKTKQNPVTDFEARIITKNGKTCQMEWRQQLCGNLLYCAGRNITSIRAQEKELTRREKQLSQAENIGRMGHWNWIIGEQTMEWSDEIYRIFGVEKGSFEPTFETMNAMVARADIARVNQAFHRALIEENDYDMEFCIRRPDDETRFIRCEGRCARDESGEVIALYGIMQDMTERMLYESDLKKAKDAAERAYAAKTQFLANMSHELRTPLNAIIGFSEMIQQQLLGPVGTEKYLEYVGGIRESGQHLLDLISDILDMSKIEAGKYELDLEEISPDKIIKLALHMMEGRAHESGVKINLDCAPGENLKVIADRRAFLQILLNVLSNAVKFTSDNGQVNIACLERKDYITIKISDNGIGIPANKLAAITRPFEQVSSSYAREHEGTGLGLAITKELIEMHGGTLFVESHVGIGTTVTIRLPRNAHKAK
ncbi:MAG: PAS domain-containing protein [Alphaproteobacteria bacterium]|nr:PAS domain-containing protein [Alphaproteobacteria bacterium]